MFLKKIGKKVLALFCIAALLTVGYADTGFAAPEIGKKTSRKTYIKAEDWPKSPAVESGSAVLIDAQSGAVLYAKNPDTLMYPASITKIMTALLTLENCDIEKKMTFTEEATQSLPYNSVAIYAEKGEKMTIEECLNACLVYSANDAASGLACEIAGSLDAFSKMMNERARELGCKNTHFNNPHGLSDDEHWTTAYDMCLIMQECVKHEKFREIASTRLYTLKKNNKRKEAFTFAAKHKMLFPQSRYYYENIVCGKTGYTKEAVNTLVTYAEKDGRGLIVCCMKAGYGVAYTDTSALFEYGFNKFKGMDADKKTPPLMLTEDGVLQSVEEAIGASSSDVLKGTTLELVGDNQLTLPKKVNFDDLAMELEVFDEPVMVELSDKNAVPSESEEGTEETTQAAEEAKVECFARVVYKYEDTIVGTAMVKKVEPEVPEAVTLEEEARTGESGGLIRDASDHNISAKVSKYVNEIMQGKHQEVVLSVAGVVGLILFLILISMISSHNKRKRNKGHSYRVH